MAGGILLTADDGFFGRPAPARGYIGIDTETELIEDHVPVPRLVCLQWFDPLEGHPQLVGYKDAAAVFVDLAKRAFSRKTPLVGHNVAFDLAVLCREHPVLWPVVWRLLDLGLVEDTIITEKLDGIARGWFEDTKTRWVTVAGKRMNLRYNLADCALYRLGLTVEKGEETWRMRYGELREVPVAQWPAEALQYALEDPRLAWALRTAQDANEANDPAYTAANYVFADAPAQTRAAWALFLCRWAGVRTDRDVVPGLKTTLEQRAQEHEAALIATGILRPGRTRPRAGDWVPPSRDMAAIRARVEAAFQAQGFEIPRTEKGATSTADDTLTQAAPLDPLLEGLQEWMSASKLGSFLTSLALGFDHPIHTEPNVIVATGRTSWGSTSPEGIADDAKKINLQNLPKMPGIREAYIPPQGMLMFSIDYSQLEMCTLGFACQQMVGFSRMLELINAGVDLHDTLAAQFMGISYLEFAERKKTESDLDVLRQLAKAGNFGFPGGMGVDKFILTARKQDEKGTLRHLLEPSTVKRLKDAWFAAFPELREYFRIVNNLAQAGQMLQLTSGRIRGNLLYTSCANSFFQGLAADGAKEALYVMQRTMFSDPTSPAYGGHVFAFVHDEFVGCLPADQAAEGVEACYTIAMHAMQTRLPGVKVKGSKCLMLRWRKKAEETRDATGRLIPFEHGEKYQALLKEGKVWG